MCKYLQHLVRWYALSVENENMYENVRERKWSMSPLKPKFTPPYLVLNNPRKNRRKNAVDRKDAG
jgi:hypothetical protein